MRGHEGESAFRPRGDRNLGVEFEPPDIERAALNAKPASLASERSSLAAERSALAIGSGRSDRLRPIDVLRLQRTAGNAGTAGLMEQSPVLDVVNSGGGSPLDGATRADMESRLGHDFGDVRVHTDAAAHASAVAVNAHAYTVGSNVVFQRDAYSPSTPSGRLTLAHELTHVVQQRSGPVDGTDAGGGVRISDPGDRFEREASENAERVMAMKAGPTAPAVQRMDGSSDEEMSE